MHPPCGSNHSKLSTVSLAWGVHAQVDCCGSLPSGINLILQSDEWPLPWRIPMCPSRLASALQHVQCLSAVIWTLYLLSPGWKLTWFSGNGFTTCPCGGLSLVLLAEPMRSKPLLRTLLRCSELCLCLLVCPLAQHLSKPDLKPPELSHPTLAASALSFATSSSDHGQSSSNASRSTLMMPFAGTWQQPTKKQITVIAGSSLGCTPHMSCETAALYPV